MKRKIHLSTSELINEIKYNTGLNTYESALVLESMLINEESPVSMLYGKMGGAMWDTVKNLLAERIIEALGYGHTKGTFVHTAVINWVESIEFSQVQMYFNSWNEGGCEMWMRSLVDTLSETLAEMVVISVHEKIKQQIDASEPHKIDHEESASSLGIDSSKISKAFSEFTGGISIDNLKSLVGTLAREKIFDVIFPDEKRDEVTAAICDAMSEFSLTDFTSSSMSGITSGLGSMFGFGEDEEGAMI
jgi:hypothetical protein